MSESSASQSAGSAAPAGERPVRIVFAGTPEPAAVALEGLLEDERLEVVGVITQPDAPRGRGRSLHPSKVAEVAETRGIPTFKWSSLKATADTEDDGAAARRQLAQWREQGVVAAAVVAYGNLLPSDLLDAFPHGWINLHYSLLPRWRGAAPVQSALAAGDEFTGATTFRIEAGMDTGPVIDSYGEPIALSDTADDLLTRLTYTGRELLADSLVALAEGAATLTPQDHNAATHAGKITSADAQIDWTLPAEVIQRTARAHTPAPGAWTMLAGKRFKIGLMLPRRDVTTEPGHGEPAAPDLELKAGELCVADKRLWVGTGSDCLEITRIQPPGKKMMAATDWARGQQQLLDSRPIFDSHTA